MTKSIENRLERIEKTLSIGKQPRVLVVITTGTSEWGEEGPSRRWDKALIYSLGPIEQWETYKRAVETGRDFVLFVPNPYKEIETRENQKIIV
jgi:hypothetical protein